MPYAAPRVCNRCNKLTTHCKCQKKSNWDNKRHRSVVQKLYQDKRWRGVNGVRNQRLKIDNHLCQDHLLKGVYVEATTVDHVESVGEIGLEQFVKQFYDVTKLRSLCSECHKQKTSRFDSKGRGGSNL